MLGLGSEHLKRNKKEDLSRGGAPSCRRGLGTPRKSSSSPRTPHPWKREASTVSKVGKGEQMAKRRLSLRPDHTRTGSSALTAPEATRGICTTSSTSTGEEGRRGTRQEGELQQGRGLHGTLPQVCVKEASKNTCGRTCVIKYSATVSHAVSWGVWKQMAFIISSEHSI